MAIREVLRERPSGKATGKLIHWMEKDEIELFNLSQDLSEQNNLATQNPEIVSRLRRELSAWKQMSGQSIPNRTPALTRTN